MITVQSREDFLRAVKGFLPPNPWCVELGVLNGDFSQMILDILNPCHLVLIDPYENVGSKYPNGFSSAYSTEKDFDNILNRFQEQIILSQVSVIRNYSHKVVDEYYNNNIDVCYHDASHLYHDIERDLHEWMPKMKQTGLVCGHDYTDIEGFGVIQAVNEFVDRYGYEMIIFNENGGDYALKKI